MSSSRRQQQQQQQQPNDRNRNNPNVYSDYEIQNDPNAQIAADQHENYPGDEEYGDDIPNDAVDEFEAQEEPETEAPDGEDPVYSDVVQEAFKRYQNEADRFLRINNFSGENLYRIVEKSNDFHQDELYAQMEECWNYMNIEHERANQPFDTMSSNEASQLNPDAVEFQPVWWKPPTITQNNQQTVGKNTEANLVDSKKN